MCLSPRYLFHNYVGEKYTKRQADKVTRCFKRNPAQGPVLQVPFLRALTSHACEQLLTLKRKEKKSHAPLVISVKKNEKETVCFSGRNGYQYSTFFLERMTIFCLVCTCVCFSESRAFRICSLLLYSKALEKGRKSEAAL